MTDDVVETSAALPAKLIHLNNQWHLSALSNSSVPVRCCWVQPDLRCPRIQSTWDTKNLGLPAPPWMLRGWTYPSTQKEANGLSMLVFLFLLLIKHHLPCLRHALMRAEGSRGKTWFFFNAWNILGIIFCMPRFDAVGAAKTAGQPSEREKFSCPCLWWYQGPVSAMSDHLRTIKALLIPTPHQSRLPQQQLTAQLIFRNMFPELLLFSPLGHSPKGYVTFRQSQLTPQSLAKRIFYELMSCL